MDNDIFVGFGMILFGLFGLWVGFSFYNKDGLFEKDKGIKLFILGGLSILGGVFTLVATLS